ncbi:MAG: hypothetical protein A2Y23_15475 [Clostridiales bacterium GWB2_37_7]|nr:MAG: hypothetical protein A2Y23_15475 [Clostridiales bacterium GWB2_37_7]
MNILLIAQIAATLLLVIVLCLYIAVAVRNIRLNRLFSKEYIKAIHTKSARKLYPFVPKPNSSKYISTKRFLNSVDWKISVEGIYLCKWCMFAAALFILVTIQTTNRSIELKEIIQDVNYKHKIIETLRADTPTNIALEKQLYDLVDVSITKSNDIFSKKNRQMYIEYIENLILQQGVEIGGDLGSTAQRLYDKVLQIRTIRSNIAPYIYIILISILVYHLPDILGQLKKKLIEDKKNWEILNCMIVFSIFGRMPPFSVLAILENMVIATEVYKPLLEALVEGLKKGGRQEAAFDAALEAVDREELYELIETMKIARRTGLINSIDDVDDTITNTVKWIEIENISRRRTKMLYAMTAMAVVVGLGCLYFAYGLTVISNPANMLIK